MEKKEISFAPGFFVDRDGNVYDKTGKVRTQYLNGDGYLGVSVKTIENKWITFGVQRLVAQAFVKNDRYDRTEVNHRDSDKTNNSSINLEWVTPRENNIHSEVSRTGNSFPTIRMYRRNQVIEMFKNLTEASLSTGFSQLEIWDSIKDNVWYNDVLFEFQSVKEPKPLEMRKNYFRSLSLKELGIVPPSKPVKILNVETGRIQYFDSVTQAGKYLQVTSGEISRVIPKNGELKLFRRKYRIQYTDEEFKHYDQQAHDVAIAFSTRSAPKEVVVFDIQERKYVRYNSAKSFVKETDLSKKAVTTALKKGKLRVFGRWVPSYFSVEGAIRLREFVEGLESTGTSVARA